MYIFLYRSVNVFLVVTNEGYTTIRPHFGWAELQLDAEAGGNIFRITALL